VNQNWSTSQAQRVSAGAGLYFAGGCATPYMSTRDPASALACYVRIGQLALLHLDHQITKEKING